MSFYSSATAGGEMGTHSSLPNSVCQGVGCVFCLFVTADSNSRQGKVRLIPESNRDTGK